MRNGEREATRITGEKKMVGIVIATSEGLLHGERMKRLVQGKTTLPPATQQFATPLFLLKSNKVSDAPSPYSDFMTQGSSQAL